MFLATIDWAICIQLATFVLAALAFNFGIRAWKREFIGRRRMALTEKTLALFYECQATMKYIRSPMGHTGEGRTRVRNPNESAVESQHLDSLYAVVERVHTHRRVFARLHSMQFRFMAVFGAEHATTFGAIHQAVNKVLLASEMLRTSYRPWTGTINATDKTAEENDRHRRTMWDAWNDNDPINQEIAAAVSTIEEIARSVGARLPK